MIRVRGLRKDYPGGPRALDGMDLDIRRGEFVALIGPSGAGKSTLLRWGVLPQLVPQFLSFTLYRFETNIRAAAILGFVGAGGIGFYTQTYLRPLNYPAAATVLLVLIVLVMIVDFASSRLRARLV